MTDTTDQVFARRIQAVIEQSDASLDGYTLSRLRRARQGALEQARGSRAHRTRWWAPAATVAASLLVALVWLQPGQPGLPSAPVDDIDILLTDESFDMLEDLEVLEFYQWLEEQPEIG